MRRLFFFFWLKTARDKLIDNLVHNTERERERERERGQSTN